MNISIDSKNFSLKKIDDIKNISKNGIKNIKIESLKKEELIIFKKEKYEHCFIEYKIQNNSVAISLILTDYGFENRGFGKKAMTSFLKMCDKKEYDVYLTPVATDDDIDKERLIEFYEAFGLKKNNNRTEMFWKEIDFDKYYDYKRVSENRA